MSLGPVARRVFLGLACVLLLALTWTGLIGGLHQFPQSHTPGEKAQTIAQFAYGVLGLPGLVTTFRARRWVLPIMACWAIALTLAAGLAPVVWGGTGIATGLLSGGAGFLIALAIIWLLRAGVHSLTAFDKTASTATPAK